MANWPFITDGIHGDVPINFYPVQDSDKKSILLGTPGLDSVCQLTSCTQVRGMRAWDGYIYAVAQRGSDSVVFKVSPLGTFAEIGSFNTSSSGPVWIINNPTQLMIVDGVWGYVYTFATGAFVAITDGDFPGAGTCAFQDGYALCTQPSSTNWFFSTINDFTTYDAGDFYAKSAYSDALQTIHVHMREPWLFGDRYGNEVWYNAGGDNSSVQTPTFARNAGGLIPFGLGAVKTTVAEEDGLPMTWLSNYGTIMRAEGYKAIEVSNQMFARAIQGDPMVSGSGFSTFSDAVAFGYVDDGHAFYQVTFPTGDETWVWDASTQIMFKKESWKAGGGYGRHRAYCYARLGNKHYVGDYINGKIYEMSKAYFDDDGETIRRQLCSQEVLGGRNRISFPNVRVTLDPGFGLPAGADPQVGLEFSSDGGKNWSNMVLRSAGLVGEYTRQASWNQLGSGYQRIYRITVSDATLWRILALDFEGEVTQ
jgi:hypothetical protein